MRLTAVGRRGENRFPWGDDMVYFLRRKTYLIFLLLSMLGCGTAPDPDERQAQILMLEDSRQADMEVFGPLLQDEDPGVRSRAVLALGRIGLLDFPDDAFRAELVRLVRDDPDASVRAMAAFALGEAQEEAALSALVAAFSDEDPQVREMAVEAASKLGVETLAGTLLDRLEAEESEAVRRRILLTSWRLGNPVTAQRAVEILMEEQSPFYKEAVYHLARFPRGDSEEPPFEVDSDLLSRLPDRLDAEGASYLARLLRQEMASDPDPQLLRRLIEHSDAGVRIEALRTAAARRMVDACEAMGGFDSDPPHVLLERLQAAAVSTDASTADKVAPWLEHDDPALVAAALASLQALDHRRIAPHLQQFLEDPRPQVRAAAVPLFPRDEEEAFMAHLGRSLQDPHPLVRNAAVQAYPREAVTDWLLDLLGHSDPVVVALAAGQIRQRGAGPYLDSLAAAYSRLRDQPNFEARSAVLRAAQDSLDQPAALQLVRDALDDPDRNIRIQAAAALAEIDGPSVREKIGPVALDRDLEYYRQALRTLKQWEGAEIETSRGSFRIRFFSQDAPLTVHNFISLAEKGFYEGITIHRTVPNFVMQAGCPRGDGWGEPGYDIRCEINTRRYSRGAVGMALAGKDTGGSQWFVTYSPQHHLDGGYTVWAEAVDGWDILHQILPGDSLKSVRLIESLEDE